MSIPAIMLPWRSLRAAADWVGAALTRLFVRTAGMKMGPGTRFLGLTYVREPAQISIGGRGVIGRDARFVTEITGATLSIGENVQINDHVRLDYTGGLVIGDDVLISDEAIVYTHDHGYDPRATPSPFSKVIQDGAWIGNRALILPGCRRIGRRAIVGSGAVVTRDIDDYTIVAGNPAKVIGSTRDPELQEPG